MLFPEDLRAILEGILFAAQEPLEVKDLARLVECSEEEVAAVLAKMEKEYERPGRGLTLRRVAGGYQLFAKPLAVPYIEKMYRSNGSSGLSRAALETLAIIAYRQPITRSEIEFIRGVKSDRAIATLLEKKLIQEVGRKEGVGRPVLFGTTKEFLRYFGLEDLSQLPPLEEFAQAAEASLAKENAEKEKEGKKES